MTGSLVAGLGAPNIDTRGAVPAESVGPVGGAAPVAEQTDPDGFRAAPGNDGAAGEPDDAVTAAVGDSDADGRARDHTAVPAAELTVTDMPVTTAPGSEASGPQPHPQSVPNETVTDLEVPWFAQPEDDPALIWTEQGAATPLTPDAILPPGTAPHAHRAPSSGEPNTVPARYAGAPADPGAVAATAPHVIAPMYPMPDEFPGAPSATGGPGAPSGPPAPPRSGARRGLLVAAGLAVAVLIAAGGAVALLVTGDEPAGPAAGPAPATSAPAAETPSEPPSAQPSGRPAPSSIDSEKTDPGLITLVDVFPGENLSLGTWRFQRDRATINDRCTLAASGAMAQALTQNRCRRVVRATFISRNKSIAVASGVAVLPNRNAAVRVRAAGDASRREWFRSLPGPKTPKIDEAGGFALSTVRGRYVVYAYATHTDGSPPGDNAKVLRNIARMFIGHAVAPVDRRAR